MSGARTSTKTKKSSFSSSRGVTGAGLPGLFLSSGEPFPSRKAETRPGSPGAVPAGCAAEASQPLSDEALVSGDLSPAGGLRACSVRDPGNGYPWCVHEESVIKFPSGSMRFITCPASRNHF